MRDSRSARGVLAGGFLGLFGLCAGWTTVENRVGMGKLGNAFNVLVRVEQAAVTGCPRRWCQRSRSASALMEETGVFC